MTNGDRQTWECIPGDHNRDCCTVIVIVIVIGIGIGIVVEKICHQKERIVTLGVYSW